MSWLVERFWRPNPKDLAGGQILQTRYTATAAASGASVQPLPVFPVVPPNVLRVITEIGGLGTPGAGQIALALIVSLNQYVGAIPFAQRNRMPNYSLAAAQVYYFGEDCEIPLKPGEQINASVLYSAGGVSNATTVYLLGYDIPIGNLQ